MRPAARRYWIALAMFGFAVFGIAVLGFVKAGAWLKADDQPAAADIIVVLAGDPARARYAADLVKAGYAAQVWVSRPARHARETMLDELGVPFPKAEDVYVQVMQKLGVPAARITVFGKDAISTVDEALALRDHAAVRATASLLIVTSPYHARRTRMVFETYLPQATVRIVSTPYESYPDRWWESQDTARNVLLELAKITYFTIGGRFSAEDQP